VVRCQGDLEFGHGVQNGDRVLQDVAEDEALVAPPLLVREPVLVEQPATRWGG
jgi:hypothetical protein